MTRPTSGYVDGPAPDIDDATPYGGVLSLGIQPPGDGHSFVVAVLARVGAGGKAPFTEVVVLLDAEDVAAIAAASRTRPS